MRPRPQVIIHTPEPSSGAARYVYELTQALGEEGWPVTLLAPANFEYGSALKASGKVALASSGERNTDPDRGLLSRVWDNLQFLARSFTALYGAMRTAQIIHFQFPLHPPFGLLQFVLAKACGLRIVFTAHDPVPHKWLFKAPWNRIERWALARTYQLSDSIVVHSTSGRRTLLAEFKVPADKLHVIPHGAFRITEPVFKETTGNALRVLLFGALRENKGIHLAIEAVTNLTRNGVPIQLAIVGETPNGKEAGYWERCEQLLLESGAPIAVDKGFVPENKIAGLLAACDCVLLPYTDFHSDSGVASLALANGKPIVATNSGGLGELLAASSLGITINEPTAAGVEAALITAWRAGGDELRRLGQNGAEHVTRHCSWERVARDTGSLYLELAGPDAAVAHASGELV